MLIKYHKNPIHREGRVELVVFYGKKTLLSTDGLPDLILIC